MKKINEKQKKILAITGCAAGAIAATFGANDQTFRPEFGNQCLLHQAEVR